MSVQPSRVHRQPATGNWQLAIGYLLSAGAFVPPFAGLKNTKMKKGAAILVQREHNSFTINEISQESGRENEQFRGKIALFQLVFGQIGEVFHTLGHGYSLPHTCSAGLPTRTPLCARSLGPCTFPLLALVIPIPQSLLHGAMRYRVEG
jgi:hypothetical protein